MLYLVAVLMKHEQSVHNLVVFLRYDPRELDVVLREVVVMNARAEMYLQFLEKRITVRICTLLVSHSSFCHFCHMQKVPITLLKWLMIFKSKLCFVFDLQNLFYYRMTWQMFLKRKKQKVTVQISFTQSTIVFLSPLTGL